MVSRTGSIFVQPVHPMSTAGHRLRHLHVRRVDAPASTGVPSTTPIATAPPSVATVPAPVSTAPASSGWPAWAGLSIAGATNLAVGDPNWIPWALKNPDAAAGDLYYELRNFFNSAAKGAAATLVAVSKTNPVAAAILAAANKMYTEKTGNDMYKDQGIATS